MQQQLTCIGSLRLRCCREREPREVYVDCQARSWNSWGWMRGLADLEPKLGRSMRGICEGDRMVWADDVGVRTTRQSASGHGAVSASESTNRQIPCIDIDRRVMLPNLRTSPYLAPAYSPSVGGIGWKYRRTVALFGSTRSAITETSSTAIRVMPRCQMPDART